MQHELTASLIDAFCNVYKLSDEFFIYVSEKCLLFPKQLFLDSNQRAEKMISSPAPARHQ